MGDWIGDRQMATVRNKAWDMAYKVQNLVPAKKKN